MLKILLFSGLLQAAQPMSLVQTLDTFFAEPEKHNLDWTCDLKYKDLKYKIAADLDQRLPEIVPPPFFETSKISADRRPGWQSFTRRWSLFYRDYHLAKDKASSDPAWYKVLREFRTLLADDQDRIVSWKNPDLGHDLGPLIERLTEMMKDCVAGGDCSHDRLTIEERSRVNMMEFYGHYTRKVFHGPEEKKQKVAQEFLKRLAVDADLYRVKNMGHRVDAKTRTIFVPLAAPQFVEKRGKLEQIFSGVWSTMGINVEIEWLHEAALNVFEILMGDFGGRPFVSVDQRKMIMPPSASEQDFAHEFGHVLGLPDQYYTKWNSRECEYIYEYDNANIMSNHQAGGVVQRHHIEALQKVYFSE